MRPSHRSEGATGGRSGTCRRWRAIRPRCSRSAPTAGCATAATPPATTAPPLRAGPSSGSSSRMTSRPTARRSGRTPTRRRSPTSARRGPTSSASTAPGRSARPTSTTRATRPSCWRATATSRATRRAPRWSAIPATMCTSSSRSCTSGSSARTTGSSIACARTASPRPSVSTRRGARRCGTTSGSSSRTSCPPSWVPRSSSRSRTPRGAATARRACRSSPSSSPTPPSATATGRSATATACRTAAASTRSSPTSSASARWRPSTASTGGCSSARRHSRPSAWTGAWRPRSSACRWPSRARSTSTPTTRSRRATCSAAPPSACPPARRWRARWRSSRSHAAEAGLEPFGWEGETPLWLYVLREADVRGGGERLGEVGGRLVAGVLLGLLDADPESYLALDPDWEPTLPAASERFGVLDLLVGLDVSAGGRGAPTLSLPDELDSRRLRRRVLQVTALFVAIALLAWLAPGLDSIRSRLEDADPGWLLLGVALEVASCASYVAMFGPGLLRAHGAAHERRDRPGGARRRLAGARRWARRARARRVGAAPRRHAHRPGGDAQRGLLPHQVRGQLRRRGRRGRPPVAGGRAFALARTHHPAGAARAGGDGRRRRAAGFPHARERRRARGSRGADARARGRARPCACCAPATRRSCSARWATGPSTTWSCGRASAASACTSR